MLGAGVEVLVGEGVYQSPPSDAMSDPLDIRGEVADHWHQGAVAVEVAVDIETGKVEILRCHGAAWAGRVINPVRARQQSEGSIIFGLGPALFEEVIFADGQVTNPNLSDYMIPSILDVPIELTSSSLESSDPHAPIHGVGEMTIPALAPAIANAIARATGARVRQMPMTAERVLRAILDEPE
jgi:CO/xanthine dehydrogenase Mo-binding subunit